jgi:hypothetical protein
VEARVVDARAEPQLVAGDLEELAARAALGERPHERAGQDERPRVAALLAIETQRLLGQLAPPRAAALEAFPLEIQDPIDEALEGGPVVVEAPLEAPDEGDGFALANEDIDLHGATGGGRCRSAAPTTRRRRW